MCVASPFISTPASAVKAQVSVQPPKTPPEGRGVRAPARRRRVVSSWPSRACRRVCFRGAAGDGDGPGGCVVPVTTGPPPCCAWGAVVVWTGVVGHVRPGGPHGASAEVADARHGGGSSYQGTHGDITCSPGRRGCPKRPHAVRCNATQSQ